MRFKVGSQAFFSDYSDFVPGDLDEIEFEEYPILYKDFMQFRKRDKTRCLFRWKMRTADEFVERTLRTKLPMEVGKFLVPDVAEYLGFTLEHLKQLEPIVNSLDNKHLYEKVIYNSYIENNGFYLTEDQRNEAYQVYKESRGC